jgi:PhnB protein
MARSARKTATKASAKKKAASKPTRKAASTARGAAKAKAAKKAPKKAPKKAAKKAATKAKRAQAVPAMYGSITPHLVVSPAPAAIEFYGRAFGAKPGMLMAGPGGLVMHAEIKIGDSIVMLADEQPPMGPGPQTRKTPKNLGGTSFGVMLYVKDVDAAYAKAVEAGATGVMPPADMFWGDRFGQVEDPFGHVWSIATHLKDMTDREMKQAAMAAPPPPAPPTAAV